MFSGIVSSPRNSLSAQKALQLANVYLRSARHESDAEISLVLCHDTEISLSYAKKAIKRTEDQELVQRIATAYIDLGNVLDKQERPAEAKVSYKKASKLGVDVQDSGRITNLGHTNSNTESTKGSSIISAGSQDSNSVHSIPVAGPHNSRLARPRRWLERYRSVANIPSHIFSENVRPPVIEYKLPEPDERLHSTQQLAGCLYLLLPDRSPHDILEPAADDWLRVTREDTDEQERLRIMAKEVIRAFKRDEIKDDKVVAEVMYLAPVLDKDSFRYLLSELHSEIHHFGLLKFHQLEGLAQLIQSGDQGHLSADDLVKTLNLLSNRLRDTHRQSSHHMHQLTLAVSHVLDAMADTKVKDLDREKLHEPLSSYLNDLKSSTDPYLVYQAAYAFQALLRVPDDETTWQAAMRRSGNVIQGVSGLVSAVKGLDLNKFIQGLGDIQKGVAGASKVIEAAKNAYTGVTSLIQSGQGLLESLNEGLSFHRKRDWYSALRGADALIRDGEMATFRMLVCKAPCRLDPAFQWGVCQRLGEIAANPMWSAGIRQGAIAFLGEIYRNDDAWGEHESVKQWILNILMQLATTSGISSQLHNTAAEMLLRELKSCGDDNKQEMYRFCRENGPISYPLKVSQTELPSPSLLDRAQNRPDVEGNIRLLRKQRTMERGNAVYIPPQAKASLQATDDNHFPLMEKVKEFLDDSKQKVFLLLGDSGSGKSTFNKELEYVLWQSYKNKTGRIPLHIHLPAIDKPDHDMIAKQLRRAEFTEPQIREMKHYRKFVLICDGYDESQQTHNLYISNRLNQIGEWDAQMVISCRTEYIGVDYRDRFQPGDHTHQSDSSLFQEAVITPFSIEQVHDYIRQYVNVHQPLWEVKDYKQALDLIPSLRDLVKNPFLMTLSLEVLPRMVDPGPDLSAARVTRVGLYDHFVEQWLERGKKRLGKKDLNLQARAAFENLSDEGFTQHGVEFLKSLAVAIYKEQDGHPIVSYARVKGEQSWKAEFFSRDEEKRLLREACPLTRNGNQHRFVHRSLLEYALARAVFDPRELRRISALETAGSRRGSVSSTVSFYTEDGEDDLEEQPTAPEQEPDPSSPLVWRSFINDHSLLKLLEERVQQEPEFKTQLRAYIEHSKKDKKWRKAAANAITILVRAGVQFIGTDLQGIRISGADLSYGVFDSAQLQSADLRKVNLRGVWLRQTDLSGALMSGVRFGELPYLTEATAVRSCAYSPDGKSIAVGLCDGGINVYSTLSWERTTTLSGHIKVVGFVVYSPEGDQIASASQDKTVRLWNSGTGLQLHAFTEHKGLVHGVAYSPQGHLVASCSDDKTVRLWDTTTGDCCKVLVGHTRAVLGVAYSPKEKHVASSSSDSTVRLWDIESGECARILSGHTEKVWDVAFSPHGDRIVSVSVDKTVRLWDAETGYCLRTLEGHTGGLNSVEYSPNGGQIASGGGDATVRIWDGETGTCQHTLTGHSRAVSVVAFSPKGDQVASGSADRTLRLWDVSAGASRLVSNGHTTGAVTIRCSPNGKLIVSGSLDRTIRLWDVETGVCHKPLSGHHDSVFGVAYSPQGDWIVSGGGDDSVRIWNVGSGECRHILTGHTGWVNSVAFSPKGDMVASASNDKTVRLWDVRSGRCRGVLNDHADGILSVVFVSDGKWIATGGKDQRVRIWDIETGECCRILIGHTRWVRDVVYSPQGDQLASASNDTTIRLWSVQTGECRLILTGHANQVWGAAYSANGTLLASGSSDKTVRLWDVSSGECRAVVEYFPDSVWCVSWSVSSKANYLVTGCNDGSVLKWEVIEEEEKKCRVQLQWSATNGALTMTGASIHGTRGLSALNKQLLKQRGAIGEPGNLLRESSRRVVSMASVLSGFKGESARNGRGLAVPRVNPPTGDS